MRDRFSGVGRRMAAVAGTTQDAAGADRSSSEGKMFDSLLAGLQMPSAPPAEAWSISVADVVQRSEGVPSGVSRGLRPLNRFGSVRLSPSKVGFDDTDVAWADVTGVRTSSILDLMTMVALEREVERLRRLLPPLPGRKWIIGRVLRVVQTLVSRATLQAGVSGGQQVVSGIRYRGATDRETELNPGLVVASLLACLPQVNASLLATADQGSIPITRSTHASADGVVPQAHDVSAALEKQIGVSEAKE